jgi:hypothetical protein
MSEEPAVHRAWRVTEPLHAMIYFVPESVDRFAALGLDPAAGYFASRAAGFGPVGPGPVVATFYNFAPRLVARALPAAWAKTTPAAVHAARLEAADAALRRGLGDAVGGPEVAEAAGLARRAAEAAAPHSHGRPLYAATAELPWPDEPHLVLFHAQSVLREFRGDGHVATLMTSGLTGLQAMVLHIASGETDGDFLYATRGWRRPQWAEAADSLRTRGLVEQAEPGLVEGAQRGLVEGAQRGLVEGAGRPALTDAGRALRAEIEAATDRLAMPAYAALGEDGMLRLAALTRPLSRLLVKAGMLNPANAFGGAATAPRS